MGRAWPIPGFVVAVALLLSAGCRREPPPDLPADDDAGDDDAAAEILGHIHLHDDGGQLALHGVFARDLPSLGAVDPLAAIGVVDPSYGYWTWPGQQEQLVPVDELELDWQWTGDVFHDAGEAITVAGVEAARVDQWFDPDGFTLDGPLVYLGGGDSAALDGAETLDVHWSGGADVAAADWPATLGMDPRWWVQLTSHDPALPHRWVEGTDLPLVWESYGEGTSVVTLMGDERWYQAVLSGDATGFTLPAEVLGDAVRERAQVSVARVGVADGPGFQLWYTRSVTMSLTYSGVLVAEPTDLFLAGSQALTVTHLDGTFVEGQTTFDLGAGITVDSVGVPGGEGPEAQLQVTVAAGTETGPRDLSAVIAGAPVLSERALRVLLPRAESCETAFPLPDEGSYHGDLSGMADDHSDPSACTGYKATGPDAVYSIVVPEYAILAVNTWIPGADAVVYLFHDCEGALAPDACSDSGGINVPEDVSFAPLPGHAGTYHIAVDVFEELPAGAGDFSLDVEIIGY